MTTELLSPLCSSDNLCLPRIQLASSLSSLALLWVPVKVLVPAAVQTKVHTWICFSSSSNSFKKVVEKPTSSFTFSCSFRRCPALVGIGGDSFLGTTAVGAGDWGRGSSSLSESHLLFYKNRLAEHDSAHVGSSPFTPEYLPRALSSSCFLSSALSLCKY